MSEINEEELQEIMEEIDSLLDDPYFERETLENYIARKCGMPYG